MKHDLLSFSFAMDDMDEIFLRVLDSTQLFLFWNNIDIGEQQNENVIQWQSHGSNQRNPLKEMCAYSNQTSRKKQQHLPLGDSIPVQRKEEEAQENKSSRHNSVKAAVSNGQTTSQALTEVESKSKQSPSPLHHTFLLRRASFTAQPLSALQVSVQTHL